MMLINSRVEVKLKWTKYYVLSVATNKNNINEDAHANNIIFNMKVAKLYVHVVTLPSRDNKKLSKLLIKGFERLVYWNEYETKNDNKSTINEFRYFLESNFIGLNSLFNLLYKNEGANSKRLKLKDIIYQKELPIIITSLSMEKTFMINQLILIENDMKKLGN